MDWSQCRSVVTGGASGLGLALANELIVRGGRVAILDVRADLEAVAAQMGAVPVRCDVSDAAQVARAASAVADAFDGLDLLVNNAGITVAGSVEATGLERLARVMAVNFMGVVHGCHHFRPLLGSGAHIVNVCSSFAWLGFPGKSAYGASKAAVRAFSESLRAELTADGIGLTLLFPGPVDTDLVRSGWAADPAQRDAEAHFLAGRAVHGGHVARRCLRGVERNQSRVVVSLDYLAIDWLVRLSPELALWLVTRMSTRMPF